MWPSIEEAPAACRSALAAMLSVATPPVKARVSTSLVDVVRLEKKSVPVNVREFSVS
jgi:uncharacterized protein (DUF2236 family)